MRKIITILGMVTMTVATTATVTAKILKQEEPVKEELVVVEDYDVSDHLYEDTFNEKEDSIENSKEEEEVEKVEENNENSSEEQNKTEEENNKEETSSSVSANSNKTTGQFQGFADNSVIEVKIGDKYDVFKVSEDIKTKLENTSIGQTITFTYTSSASQKVITSIN